MAKEIIVFVEKHEDVYWGTSQNYEGVVSSFGSSFEELKANFEEAFADNLELAKELGEDYADNYSDIVFLYQMDLSSMFNLVKEIKISAIAKKAGINESLARQYKTGLAAASVEQAMKIQNAIHSLGQELLSIRI
ncbi:type II toxin-antitoxin system HicB family antitoxin [Riemerella anatipestifer]|uniref:hypothetical protein n=1 Tax=Riemerella anatipestifer TaxID=34085 RepID=UPI0007EC6191|nr:hypothetical protein [Riemerella anatipestifer]MDD1549310.1 type II toxin-antitoxin system HicB family antitoxin [Riemerella anatipestifer]MDR7832022.1 type II toxin-antitoxin system HicB family antitoxin [Riemerella anatipestifer]MRM96402.1 type II toxin-antitoxin system HicB family antitoxin [Riemerella anatipestifer]OBP65141.1 hypothetical protein AWB84_01225 [Riemerella anatipestifer]QZO83698.1 type II toxin-antitoxin system HicB family antitoxin [Riemerella anatipestifer]